MMSSDSGDPSVPRRKALKVAASALCSEVGFSHAEDAALETLTEMLQSYLTELGRSTQAFAELSCRTEPMLSDVVMALIEMGMDVQSLPAYAKRPNKTVFMPPMLSAPAPNPRSLQVGSKKGHPSHIPDYLPAFPDPHTYIRSLTHKKPANEYQLIREKAATQKRDVERALTRFIAKTGDTENLFEDDPYAFPLIACKPKPLPYLDALLPKDQDLDAQDEPEEPSQQVAPKTEKEVVSKSAESSSAQETPATSKPPPQESSANITNSSLDLADSDSQIDNPYLRPIKMPKLKGGKKSKLY